MTTFFGDETKVDDGAQLQVRTLTGGGLGTNNRFQFRGLPVSPAAENTGFGSGTMSAPVIQSTFEPDFFRILTHLLPRSRSWLLTADKQLRSFFKALSITLGDDIRKEVGKPLVSDCNIDEWDFQFNLANTGLSDEQRIQRVNAAWQATGSLGPDYLQDVLQGQGFDVYVHEWWEPGTEPAVGVKSCVTPRNPLDVLRPSYLGAVSGMQAGEALAQAGEDFAVAGNVSGALGYPLVNKVRSVEPDYIMLAGEGIAQAGEALAQAGSYTEFKDEFVDYVIPNDPLKWPYFVYIGGQTFPDAASVSVQRRDEFEALLLKYCPAHMWIGVIVTYS